MTGTMPTPSSTGRRSASAPPPAKLTRGDIVATALRLLDEGGLAGLSMRNIAAALGIRPSALYWHVPNKQSLLAAVSDAILEGAVSAPSQRQASATSPRNAEEGRAEVLRATLAVREALLAVTDGAEVVASTVALGLGERRPGTCIRDAVGAFAPDRADIATTTITSYLLGHTQQWQQRRFAERLDLVERSSHDERQGFLDGLELLLDGVACGSLRG